MINVYNFGRDRKKTNIVLWAVVASLAIGSLSTIVFAPSSMSQVKVAKVNGSPIYFDRYRKELVSIQEQLNSLKQMAKMYGLSEEMMLQAYGLDNPGAKALDNCVREALYDHVKSQLNMRVDREWFKKDLIKKMPQFIGQDGRVNIAMYNNYMQRLGMTPAEFEAKREEDVKRDMVYKFMQQTAYVPGFLAKEAFVRDEVKRSFNVVTVKLEHFQAQAKKIPTDQKELEAYYLTNKEKYRIPEKRKATYWELDTTKVTNAVEIDQATLLNFYEKNKATIYRIPPKVKVRHILIKATGKKMPAQVNEILKKAQAEKADFSALVKQYSEDAVSVAQGGLIDLSVKGTRDPEFEKAAFRLKTKGEVSPVVKTKDGYEIIQLVERVNASEKPFESVRADILASLRAKRAMGHIRAELEQLVRLASEDESVLAAFTKKYGLVAKESSMLTESDAKDADIEGLIAKKLFSSQKRANGFGYFAHENKYVIFQATTLKKSHISALADIMPAVTTDYINDQARTMARRALKNAYAAVIAGEKTLNQISSELGGSFVATSAVASAKDLKEFGDEKTFKDRLFNLTDTGHMLFFASEKNYYLARIGEMEAVEQSEFVAKRTEYAKKEAAKIAGLQAGAFIASLHRNAKIEIEDKRLLDMQPEPERD